MSLDYYVETFQLDATVITSLSATACAACDGRLQLGIVTLEYGSRGQRYRADYPGKRCMRCGQIWSLPGEVACGLAAAEVIA